MKIKLKKKETQYAQVHVNLLRNKTISLRAKGLGSVLESYSNDFEVSVKSIELGSLDGAKAIKTAIKELEQGYYLFRFQTHDKSGQFITYWAFDSQTLNVDYLKEMISELEKVELITKNNLLKPGYQKGTSANNITGVPFTGCGETVDGETAGGQSTTYNNTTNQNSLDKNNSLYPQRDIFKNFQSFKAHFIEKNTNVEFQTQGIGYATTTTFKVNINGYIVNIVSGEIITKQEAYQIWEFLYTYYKAQRAQKIA